MMEIKVHPKTDFPNTAWNLISKTQKFAVTRYPWDIIRMRTHVEDHKARIVCMGDTHCTVPYFKFQIPDGDIFIHVGDFSNVGLMREVQDFNEWLGYLPHRYKIVIAGNHELTFDPERQSNGEKEALTNCTYLQDELFEIWGLRIYGSPWQPSFREWGKWAFNLPRGSKILEKWNQIPAGIDILVTHGPPIGYGDLCFTGERAGCVELLSTIQRRVKPKYHVYGHIHEGYGMTTDGEVKYVNASTCDRFYVPINKPIVFDLEIPPGFEKVY